MINVDARDCDAANTLSPQSVYLDSVQIKVLKKAGFKIKALPFKKSFEGQKYLVQNAIVSPSWVIGGMRGGNCWGDEADEDVDAETKPQWLEEFLEKSVSRVSFSQFRKIQKVCVQYEYTEYEYYGNSTSYAFEVLKVSDLLAILMER